MTDMIERVANELGTVHAVAVLREGEAFGCPMHSSLIRPLVRRGLFQRVERKGFQTRWALTNLGEDVRAYLVAQATIASSGEAA